MISSLFRFLYFFFYGSAASWWPYFNVYLKEIGLTGLQIGTIASVRPAVIIISQPLWGVTADKFGHRLMLLVSLFSGGLFILGYTWGTEFWYLIIMSILVAFFSSPAGPLLDSLALDFLEDIKKLSFGYLRLWGGIGWAVVAFVTGRFLVGRDLRLIFTFASVTLLIAWLIALRTPKNLESPGGFTGTWKDLGNVLRNRNLLLFLGVAAVSQLGMTSLFTFFPIYMTELGASSSEIGLAFAIQGISEIPMYFLSGPIIKKLGINATLVGIFLIYAARAFLYSIIKDPILAVIVQVTHLSIALFIIASVEYVNLLVPAMWRATGQSLLWVAQFGIGSIVGQLLSGYIYDQVGVQQLFRLSGFILLGVALITMVLLRSNNADLKEPAT